MTPDLHFPGFKIGKYYVDFTGNSYFGIRGITRRHAERRAENQKVQEKAVSRFAKGVFGERAVPLLIVEVHHLHRNHKVIILNQKATEVLIARIILATIAFFILYKILH